MTAMANATRTIQTDAIADRSDPLGPLTRMFGGKQRFGVVILSIGAAISSVVHLAAGAAARVTSFEIVASSVAGNPIKEKTQKVSCEEGQLVEFAGIATTRLGGLPPIGAAAQWWSSNSVALISLEGGLFQCKLRGVYTVTALYDRFSSVGEVEVTPAVIPIEDEKTPPPPPPPPPEPSPEAKSPLVPEEVKPTAAPPPPPAKAGALLTAPDDPKHPTTEKEYTFTTDPNGSDYAGGTTIGKGGGDDPGKPWAVPSGSGTGVPAKGSAAPPPPPPAPTVAVSTVDRSRKPALPDANCRGYFPGDADDDTARVSLTVTIKPTGEVATASVVEESPKGQGFGKAARTCILSKRFSPAADRDGNAIATSTTVNLTFTR